jgi:hypothetical protein
MNGMTLTWKRTPANTVVPVGPGVYFAPAKGASLAARAALLSGLLPAEAVIGRRTAAWIWGLDVLPPGVDETDWPVDLITPEPAAPLAPDTVEIPPEHAVEKSGVRLTVPIRTALDCARWLPRMEAVAALDQFLRRGVKVPELTAMARTLHGYRGNRKLREIVRLSDRGAASPGETWTRIAIVNTGLPRPRTQVPVMGPRGRRLHIDLGYPEFRVGLEYDGERHHTGPRARAHDRARRGWLGREMQWEIIPVTRDFLVTPAPYLGAHTLRGVPLRAVEMHWDGIGDWRA